MKPEALRHAPDVAELVTGHDNTTAREDVLATALRAVHTPLVAAVLALPAGDAAKLQRLLALGTEDVLAKRVDGYRETQAKGAPRPWSPTTQLQWLEGLAVQIWRELGKGSRS